MHLFVLQAVEFDLVAMETQDGVSAWLQGAGVDVIAGKLDHLDHVSGVWPPELDVDSAGL